MAEREILCPGNQEFFTVLLPGFSEKLPLPRKFISNINTKKFKRAVLRSPLGNWHVKIQGNGGNLYFGEGWQEFAQAHKLNVGFFLVFNYEGDMVFNVTVFDRSMCMKEYTPVNNSNSNAKNHADDLIFANDLKTATLQKSMKRKRRAVGTFKNKPKTSEMNSFCASEPHFKATIRPSNLLLKPYMNLPHKFRASSNMSKKDQIILRDPKGRSWPVRIYYSSNNAVSRRAQLGSGWEKFWINNNLEEGDTCVFKLVSERGDDILHVSIFKKKK